MTAILKVDEIQDTSGNLIIKEDSNTITIGASGDTITIPSGATITNSGTATGFGGITMADQWRYTTATAGDGDLTSNLERNDSTGFGQLGTGMTESSGVFTFPSTGIYLISFGASFYNASGDSRFNRANIKVTTNNSSYTDVSRGVASHNIIASSFTYSEAFTQYILDVTDTSNVKVMFNRDVQDNDTYIEGDTSINKVFMTFIRLGDT